MVLSPGSRSRSALSTVRPPTPESNTPMGPSVGPWLPGCMPGLRITIDARPWARVTFPRRTRNPDGSSADNDPDRLSRLGVAFGFENGSLPGRTHWLQKPGDNVH